jgi:hypothetical protein
MCNPQLSLPKLRGLCYDSRRHGALTYQRPTGHRPSPRTPVPVGPRLAALRGAHRNLAPDRTPGRLRSSSRGQSSQPLRVLVGTLPAPLSTSSNKSAASRLRQSRRAPGRVHSRATDCFGDPSRISPARHPRPSGRSAARGKQELHRRNLSSGPAQHATSDCSGWKRFPKGLSTPYSSTHAKFFDRRSWPTRPPSSSPITIPAVIPHRPTPISVSRAISSASVNCLKSKSSITSSSVSGPINERRTMSPCESSDTGQDVDSGRTRMAHFPGGSPVD